MKTSVTEKILRIGLAFSFIYPPISAFINPYAWVGYFPTFIIQIIPIDSLILLHIFGVFELGIAVWILFGKKILIPSVVALVSLFLIVACNFTQMDILFRDIPIMLMALLLCILNKKDRKTLA